MILFFSSELLASSFPCQKLKLLLFLFWVSQWMKYFLHSLTFNIWINFWIWWVSWWWWSVEFWVITQATNLSFNWIVKKINIERYYWDILFIIIAFFSLLMNHLFYFSGHFLFLLSIELAWCFNFIRVFSIIVFIVSKIFSIFSWMLD